MSQKLAYKSASRESPHHNLDQEAYQMKGQSLIFQQSLDSKKKSSKKKYQQL